MRRVSVTRPACPTPNRGLPRFPLAEVGAGGLGWWREGRQGCRRSGGACPRALHGASTPGDPAAPALRPGRDRSGSADIRRAEVSERPGLTLLLAPNQSSSGTHSSPCRRKPQIILCNRLRRLSVPRPSFRYLGGIAAGAEAHPCFTHFREVLRRSAEDPNPAQSWVRTAGKGCVPTPELLLIVPACTLLPRTSARWWCYLLPCRFPLCALGTCFSLHTSFAKEYSFVLKDQENA